MKKLFAALMVILMILSVPFSAYAEENEQIDLGSVYEEIIYNTNNSGYDFSVESAEFNEDAEIIEVFVSDNDYETASDYFFSLYGDYVSVNTLSGSNTETEDYEAEDDNAQDVIEPDELFDDEPSDEIFDDDAYTADSTLSAAWAAAGYDMYPDYVFATYIGENGKLVVALCNDTESNRNKVIADSGNSDALEFVSVKYSYNELNDIVNEITLNVDQGNYPFLVNFASIDVRMNVVEVSVGNSDLEAATPYFTDLYGDKITLFSGYDVEEDTDFEEDSVSVSRADKIASTHKLRTYISLGIIGLLIAAVLVTVFLSQNKKASSGRRYKK